MRLLPALAFVPLACLVAAPVHGAPKAAKSTATRPAKWYVYESANFRVSSLSQRDAGRLAARCEELRQQLAGVWLGPDGLKPWTKRCQVIVYPTLAAYLRAVGREAVQTAGSALIETDGKQIFNRQIDLRGDIPGEMQSALAHELTHVIVADRIDRAALPAWADEGMAVLADHPEKQAAHLHDLNSGFRARNTFRTGELIALEGYPRPDRMGVFYGQSGSLVSYLVHRASPQQFIRFMEVALEQGYDAALRQVYKIDGVSQLERLWLKSLQSGEVRFASYVPGQIWSKSAAPAEG